MPCAGAVVVLHEKNTGYGAAVRSCFDYAKEHGFDVMTILDGGWQHYSYGMDRVFFEQLELPDARYNLDVGSGSGRHREQTGRMLSGIEEIKICGEARCGSG